MAKLESLEFGIKVRECNKCDRIEIVFCEECKHKEDCIERIEFIGRNPVLELNTYEYHPLKFCSYGERRCG